MDNTLTKPANNYVCRSKNELEAFNTQKISECPQVTLSSVLMSSVLMAYDILGWESTVEHMKTMASILPDEVLKQCPFVRIDEIPIAVNLGVHGEFGEFMGINTASIVKFIKSYYNSKRRAEIAHKLAPKEEKKEPSPEELRAQENKIIINAFDKWVATGIFEDYGNHVYNKLDERKLIPFNNERKLEFMDQAKQRLLEKNSPKLAKTKEEKKTLDQMTVLIFSKTNEARNMIIREAKQIALLTYFGELNDLEIHIRDEIQE